MSKEEYSLTEGKKAPAFSLSDRVGAQYQLRKLTPEYIVIFFYPKDSTPGCTIEARGFNALLEQFEELDALILGISGGDEKTKKKFCQKQELSLVLLSDTDFSVSKKYEVYGEKNFMGKTFDGIHRQTFILDKERRIIKRFSKVSPKGHPEEVLEFIKNHK